MADATTYTMEYNIRRRPLHTCGIAALSIVHIICTRTREIEGPLGCLPRTLAKRGSFMQPMIRAFVVHLLALLSFVDDYVLAVVMIISSRFPSSYRVFSQVDSAVFLVEKLPEKFDDMMKRIPLVLHRVPLVERAVFRVIEWVNSVIVMLTMGAFNNANEKETGVDFDSIAETEEFSLGGKVEGDEDRKEARKRRRGNSASQDHIHGRENQESGAEESFLYMMEDPILQLFEEGWQAPRTGGSFMLSSNSSML